MTKAELEKLTTKHLLNMLAMDRASGYPDDEYSLWDDEDLRAVLATREHVPNKKEGEVIRRNKQKTRRDARDRRYVR